MAPPPTPEEKIQEQISQLEKTLAAEEKTIRVGNKNTQKIKNDINDLKTLASAITQAVKLYSDQLGFIQDQKNALDLYSSDIQDYIDNRIKAPGDQKKLSDAVAEVDKRINDAKNEVSTKQPKCETEKNSYDTALADLDNVLRDIDRYRNQPNDLIKKIAAMNELKKKIEEAQNKQQDNLVFFWHSELLSILNPFAVPQPTAGQYSEQFTAPLQTVPTLQEKVRTAEQTLNECKEELDALRAQSEALERNRIHDILKALEAL